MQLQAHLLLWRPINGNRRRRTVRLRHSIVTRAAASSSFNNEQNHYAVLGITQNATSADIKRAYSLLARKYHPDVNKDPHGGEVFKSIRSAYEVLSDQVRRSQYDKVLKFQKEPGWSYRCNRKYNIDFDDEMSIHRWAKYRQKLRRERLWDYYKVDDENSSYSGRNGTAEGGLDQGRGSFIEVLISAFVSLFLLQTFGYRLSLTFSSLTALFDGKLDTGYKIGYLVAWVLGGRGGILLTLCLSFASWVFGKSSSSMVAIVVLAMWTCSHIARYARLPQGAILTLIYMSIKLQLHSK